MAVSQEKPETDKARLGFIALTDFAPLAIAMRNTVPEFLVGSSGKTILAEFMADKIDLGRAEGLRMVA